MSINNQHIQIPGYGKINHMTMKPEYFYRRSAALYGVSGTGKSTVLDNIMLCLKPYIPNVIVFNPTGDVAQSSLQDRVPKGTIHLDPQIQAVEDIFERQQQAIRIYDTVNDLNNLKRVFEMCNSYTSNEFVKNIIRKSFIQIIKIQKSNLSAKDQTDQIQSIKKTKNKYLKEAYKNTIRKFKNTLLNSNSFKLTEVDKYVIVYLDFCPDILLVTDDAAAWIKKNSKHDAIVNVFFQGRHYGITCIHCLQNDKTFGPEIRKSIFVSIFTEVSCALTFFQNKLNGIPKSMLKQAEATAETIFKDSSTSINDGPKNYKKLVYNRMIEDINKFQYYIANPDLNFKFGCDALWKLWDNIPKKQDKSILNEENTFFKSFAIK